MDPSTLLERTAAWSNDEIVRRVLAGDSALFEVLMRRLNDRVYRAARAVLKSDSEAEDVMQEAYVRAWSHLGQYAQSGQFAAWVTRIAINEALLRARRKSATTSLEALGVGVAAPASPPERGLELQDLARLIEDAVESLPTEQRLVFVLRDVQQLSVSETALCLEISEGNVRVRLHRARSRLREGLLARVGGACEEVFSFHRPRCDRVVRRVLERIDGPAQRPGR